jgi:hypothetical protein
MDAMGGEERVKCEIVKFLAVVCLQCENGDAMLCGNVSVEAQESGKHFILPMKRKSPNIMSEIIKKN